MTRSSSVAYSELTRVLPWSIRARGYSFGTADRAAFLVANAASLSPELLEDVASLRDRPDARPRLQSTEGVLTVDAMGASLLEVGPATMDYCAAQAGQQGHVTCHVSGATELSLLPAVLLVGTDYDLSAVALRIEGGALKWSLAGWAQDAPERPVFLSGEGMEDLDRHLAGVVDPGDLPKAFNGVIIYAWRQPKILISAQESGMLDAHACFQRAFSNGIPIAPEILEALYEMEKITWAPTSERSRAQAGFQPKPTGTQG